MATEVRVGGLRDRLLADGVLLAQSTPGLYVRSAAFEAIVAALSAAVQRAAVDQAPTVLRFPPVMAREDFARTGYLRSFPDLLGSVHTFRGDDRAHAELLRRQETGAAEWTELLEPAPVVLCSAACHPLYPLLAGSATPAEGLRFDVAGWCFRAEPSPDPARMQSFRMHEIVFVGPPEDALVHRDGWLERGEALLRALGLPVERVVANDPFFGRAGRILASSQRAEELKYELVVEVSNAEQPTAILSANCHREHFGEEFGIAVPDGGVAHSACVGFGLERVTLALLRFHGTDPAAWPVAVRERLWP